MHVNILLFEGLTQLDMTGPYEVLASAPGFTVDFVAKRGTRCDPTTDWPSWRRAPWPMRRPATCWWCPAGRARMMPSSTPNGWISRAGRLAARYVFGICTGSLLLGAAGLRGRRASSHWRARELLSRFGAIPSDERMCGRPYLHGGRRHLGYRHGFEGGRGSVRRGRRQADPAAGRVRPRAAVPRRHAENLGPGHRAALPGAIAGALREPVGEGRAAAAMPGDGAARPPLAGAGGSAARAPQRAR